MAPNGACISLCSLSVLCRWLMLNVGFSWPLWPLPIVTTRMLASMIFLMSLWLSMRIVLHLSAIGCDLWPLTGPVFHCVLYFNYTWSHVLVATIKSSLFVSLLSLHWRMHLLLPSTIQLLTHVTSLFSSLTLELTIPSLAEGFFSVSYIYYKHD